jgi:hypothetical protein
MWAYWLGILIGLIGSMMLGIAMNGCASSIGGVAVVLVIMMVATGQLDALFMIAGPGVWRDRIEKMNYHGSTLLLTGLTVGAMPIALTLMLFSPNLQGPLWLTIGLPLMIFVFGVPAGSLLALFILSQPKGNRTADHRGRDEQDDSA